MFTSAYILWRGELTGTSATLKRTLTYPKVVKQKSSLRSSVFQGYSREFQLPKRGKRGNARRYLVVSTPKLWSYFFFFIYYLQVLIIFVYYYLLFLLFLFLIFFFHNFVFFHYLSFSFVFYFIFSSIFFISSFLFIYFFCSFFKK